MKVSIVIPVHNRPEQVLDAITSVLSQSQRSFELIIVDDASTPPLQLPVEISADKRISLIRKNINGGAGAARNTGAATATGDWIAWLDSDDQWHPDKLAVQLKAVENIDPATTRIALASGYKTTRKNQFKELHPMPSNDPLMFFSGCWFCPGSTVILPRALFERIGPYDEKMRRLEDIDWFARFALEGGRLETVPEILVEIDPDHNADYDLVCKASDYLFDKYSRQKDQLPNKALDRLWAYLELIKASSALLKNRKIATGLRHLLASLLKKPRLRLQLEQFNHIQD